MFYNSFAKTVISHGLLIYGTAAKRNVKKLEMAQRRVLRAFFFKPKYDLVNVLQQNELLFVFEFYIVALIKQLFRHFQKKFSASTTRFRKNYSLPLARGRTLIQKNAVKMHFAKVTIGLVNSIFYLVT